MTKGELQILEREVDEINEILDICDERFDRDILDRYHDRLDEIQKMLTTPNKPKRRLRIL